MPAYRYLVGQLLPPFTLLDELPLTSCQFDFPLNQSGAINATIPLRHPKTTPDNLAEGQRALYVERDNTLLWGGSLEGIRKNGDQLQLTGLGFWHRAAQRRRIRTTKTYTGVDQLAIAQDLLNYAQSFIDGNYSIVVPATTSGVLRDRTYNGYERKPLGEAIEQLAAVSNGFDFAVDVSYDSNHNIVLTFNTSYPQRGRRTDYVFELGVNLLQLDYTRDATRQQRTVDALGSGQGDTMLIGTASDATQAGIYPLSDDVVSYIDVIDQTTLDSHASSALNSELLPVFLPVAKVRSTIDVPIGGWITGDQVQLRADDGFTDVNSWFRITTWGVSVDENGSEDVTLGFSPVERYS